MRISDWSSDVCSSDLPHADNVAPSLLGGFTLVRSYEPLDVIHLPVPANLYCSVIFPHVDVPTRAAREMIRKKVLLKDAVQQWGNIAGLVSGQIGRAHV